MRVNKIKPASKMKNHSGDKISIVILLCAIILVISLFMMGCGYQTQIERIKTEEEFVESVDVLVLGGTLSGRIAALEAARNGAQVMVITEEKILQNVDFNKGVIAFLPDKINISEETENVETEPPDVAQPYEEELEEFNLENFKELMVEYGDREGSMAHLERIANKSSSAVEWMENNFEINFVRRGDSEHRYYPEKKLDKVEIEDMLTDKGRLKGVKYNDNLELEILKNSPLDSYQIEVIDQNGVKGEIFTRTLIFAGGGFLGEEEIMRQYAPHETPAPWRSNENNPFWNLAMEHDLEITQIDYFRQVLILKNERITLPLWEEGYGQEFWLVSSEGLFPLENRIATDYRQEVMDLKEKDDLLLVMEKEKMLESDEYENMLTYYETYENMEELKLRHYNLDAEGLSQKIPDNQEIKVASVQLVADYCLGGLKIDRNYQVIKEGRPIKGIYALGEISGGVWGKNAMPGSILLEKVIAGQKVGKQAAQLANN